MIFWNKHLKTQSTIFFTEHIILLKNNSFCPEKKKQFY